MEGTEAGQTAACPGPASLWVLCAHWVEPSSSSLCFLGSVPWPLFSPPCGPAPGHDVSVALFVPQ